MRKIISITLALLLLTNNLGLALSSHLCKGQVVETRLVLGQAELGCGMEMSRPACGKESPRGARFTQIPCCETTFTSLSPEVESAPTVGAPSLAAWVVVATVFGWATDLQPRTEAGTLSRSPSPPLLRKHALPLLQVFLL